MRLKSVMISKVMTEVERATPVLTTYPHDHSSPNSTKSGIRITTTPGSLTTLTTFLGRIIKVYNINELKINEI